MPEHIPEDIYVFLDANVIFSASYRPDSSFLEFWRFPRITLVTSSYAVEEVRRNCRRGEHLRRLELLLDQTLIVSDPPYPILPAGIVLPPKDQPILASAIDAGAAFLITGDKNHFAPWMNRPIKTRHGSLVIMKPRPFLNLLSKNQ
jgi:predicted nucleic acid-binding protein